METCERRIVEDGNNYRSSDVTDIASVAMT